MTDNPLPQPTEPAPKKPRASQDQEDANLINTYRTRLIAIKGNGDAVALLTPRGFDIAGLDEGLTACDAGQTTFNVREIALHDKGKAAEALKAAEQAARKGYAGFSRIAAKVLKDDPAAKARIVVPSRLIQDQDKFLTFVETAYAAAMDPGSHQAGLSKRGYAPDALQAEVVKLKAFSQACADYEITVQAANRTTAEREAVMKALKTWWAEFYATAQVALKNRPDLLGLLDV